MSELAVAIFVLIIGWICRREDKKNREALCKRLASEHDAWASDIERLKKDAEEERTKVTAFKEQLSRERKRERDEIIEVVKRVPKKNK